MLGKQATLFELLGFKVRIDASWLFLALLIAWSLAEGFFPSLYPKLAPATYWWMGVAGVIGLFFSLVLHELSHALVARRYGLRIRGITLFIFGGVAEMTEEPANPKTEFLMAIAGPIASALLALVFLVAGRLGAGAPVPVVGLVHYLALLNGMLAAFNVLPAFPLDGGRVLRAALWHWRGDLRWATRIAAGIGGAIGIAMIALGVLNVLTGNFVGGMWWFLIGLFLRAAAAGSYYQLITRRALEGERVRRFMTPDPITVAPELSLERLVEDYVYRYHHETFPIVEGDRLLGAISIRDVKRIPRERWPWVRVAEAGQPASEANTIEADEDAVTALARMQRNEQTRLMVVEKGRLVGIVALKDMLRLLALKVDLERD